MKCGEKNSVKAERRKGNRGKRIMTKSRLKRQKMREGRRKVQRWKEGVGISKLFLKLFFFFVLPIFSIDLRKQKPVRKSFQALSVASLGFLPLSELSGSARKACHPPMSGAGFWCQWRISFNISCVYLLKI